MPGDHGGLVLEVVPVEVAQGAGIGLAHEVVIARDADHDVGGHVRQPAENSELSQRRCASGRSSAVGQMSPATRRTSQGGTAGRKPWRSARQTNRMRELRTRARSGSRTASRRSLRPTGTRAPRPGFRAARAGSGVSAATQVTRAMRMATSSSGSPGAKSTTAVVDCDRDVAGGAIGQAPEQREQPLLAEHAACVAALGHAVGPERHEVAERRAGTRDRRSRARRARRGARRRRRSPRPRPSRRARRRAAGGRRRRPSANSRRRSGAAPRAPRCRTARARSGRRIVSLTTARMRPGESS